MTKRLMTIQEEAVYRLVSHDFAGLSQIEAAECAGLSQSQVSRILKKIEKEHPSLFPILNARQKYVYKQIVKHGKTHKEIAVMMGTSIRTIERVVGQLRKKGVSFSSPVKSVPYKPWMDGEVKNVY